MVFFNIITWVIIDQMHKTANKRRSVDIECLVKLMGCRPDFIQLFWSTWGLFIHQTWIQEWFSQEQDQDRAN